MGVVRFALAAVLALQPVVQAAELAPVDILLTRVIPQDEAALATAGPEKGARLALLQSDLALVVEGLEGFASEADAGPSLKRLQESVDAPEQFKDRAAALDAAYRALAVVDYTWAKRLPEAPCAPDASRAALLKSGALSSWIASLLGVDADVGAALDRASASTKASAREYALLRAKVRRLSDALGSEKAIGAARASLYCRRAGAYEALSAANRTSGLTAASRATGDDDVTGVYMLARPSASGWEILGAATSIDGAIVTDARLADSEGLVLFRREGKKPIPVTVERRDSGLALLRSSELVKGLVLAEAAPAKDDLIEALGHPERTGAWTRTRGLVTSADAVSFQSDAVVDVGMAGGAALTEDGKVAGVFVLRRARSGDEAFDWPVAVSAPALKSWLAGGVLTAPSGSVEIAEAGTASILTASRPLLDSLKPGSNATAASSEFTYQGIRFVCKANCDDPAPAPAPRARSRTRYTNPRSSYGGSDANAELGKAIGEAMAPLVEAMVFKGIPALFRGIGSLFKSKPKTAKSPGRVDNAPPLKPKPLPEPNYEVRITAIRPAVHLNDPVQFVAVVTRNREDMPLSNINITFAVQGGQSVSGVTDSSGRVLLSIEQDQAEKAHGVLDEESRLHPQLIETGRKEALGACKAVGKLAVGAVWVTIVAASLMGGPPVAVLGGVACVKIVTAGVALGGVSCAAIIGADAVINSKSNIMPPPVAVAKAGDDKVHASSERAHDSLGEEERESVERDGATGQPGDPDDPDPEEVKELERSFENRRMTAKDAESAAEKLGYDKKIPTQKAPFNSHGQPVFQSGNKYITPDTDRHSGGAWKMFNRAGQRLGTFDKNLVRIGD